MKTRMPLPVDDAEPSIAASPMMLFSMRALIGDPAPASEDVATTTAVDVEFGPDVATRPLLMIVLPWMSTVMSDEWNTPNWIAMLLSSKVLPDTTKPLVDELNALSSPIRDVFSVLTRMPLEKLLRNVLLLIEASMMTAEFCVVITKPLPPAGLVGMAV